MVRSRFGYTTPIANVSTSKKRTKQLSYKGGVDSYTDNDDVSPDTLVYATDMRQVQIGQYRTRRGAERYSVPVGEAVSYSEASTTGASVFVINGTTAVAQKATVSTSGCITKVDVNIRSTANSKGTVIVELMSDNSGEPGDVIATSSIHPAAISSTFGYKSCYFMEAPELTSSSVVWVGFRLQSENDGEYEVSTTTASSLSSKKSTNGAWQANAFSINAKVYSSTKQAIKGIYRAYRYNGVNKTYFGAGTNLYSIDDLTGAATSIYSALSSAAERLRFDMAQDAVYFVDGVNKPFKLDLTTNTVSSVTAAPAGAFLCIEHKGLMMYVNVDDRNQIYFSNFAAYDTFKSTDFLTVGPPKSSGGIVALAKLNGALYAFERRNKYVIYGESNATWSIDEATDQRGAFSQESVTFDENYIYHADTDGVHQFNGTESRNLAKNFLSEYQGLLNKDNIVLELKDNRLYIFYTPNGQSENTECFVYNLLLDCYEGRDTTMYVSAAFGRYAQNDILLLGSNRVAALYYAEPPYNAHNNLGAPLKAEIRTTFSHFDSPAQTKRVPKWRPSFVPQTGSFSVQAGYAYDLSQEATWTDINVNSGSLKYDNGLKYDTGLKFADPYRLIEPSNLYMSGGFRRVQRIYKHHAANEPFEFNGEVLEIEEQRMN